MRTSGLGCSPEAQRRQYSEFKRDLSSPDGALKCLVAFANTAGGTLIVGIEDELRHVKRVPNVLASEEKLANLIADSIRPRLVPEIEILPWRKVNVIAVQVFPSNTRPHYLERLGPDNGVFIRVGSTNRKADAVQIQELRSLSRPGSFDEQAIPELNSEAIDFRVASELLAPYKKVETQTWTNLRVVSNHQRKLVPTIGGLFCCLARIGLRTSPILWIQMGRFAGMDRTRLVDSVSLGAIYRSPQRKRSPSPRSISRGKRLSRAPAGGPVVRAVGGNSRGNR